MQTRRVADAEGELAEALRRLDARESTEGIAVFVAAGSEPATGALDPVLCGLSTPVFGGVFPEIVHGGEAFAEGAVLADLSVRPDVTTITGLDDPETSFEAALPEEVAPGRSAFVFVDAFADGIEAFTRSLFNRYGLEYDFLGGGAGTLADGGGPCLVTDRGLVEGAGVFATVEASTGVGVEHGWRDVAGPFRVTGSSGRTVSSLGDRPAFEAYRRAVESDSGRDVPREAFFEVAKSYPFGISRLGGERIVRDPHAVTDDGSLQCFGDVPEGEMVHVLTGDPESLISAAEGAYRTAVAGRDGDENASAPSPGDAAVLLFDCISRVLYLGDDFGRELAAVGGEGEPDIGALTIGEIANDGRGNLEFYNKTVVAALFEED